MSNVLSLFILSLLGLSCLSGLILSNEKQENSKSLIDHSSSNTNNELSSTLPKGIYIVKRSFTYECPDEYKYLNYSMVEDVTRREKACGVNPSNYLFRLAGGGSMTSSETTCLFEPSDLRVASYNLCAKWTINGMFLSQQECYMNDQGSVMVLHEEVDANAMEICDTLKISNITARLGLSGTAFHINEVCTIKDWDEGPFTHYLCMKPSIDEVVMSINENDKNCRTGNSLITVDEALRNRQVFCDFIDKSDKVRLSGGAAMTGSDLGCKIVDYEPDDLHSGLCAAIDRGF